MSVQMNLKTVLGKVFPGRAEREVLSACQSFPFGSSLCLAHKGSGSHLPSRFSHGLAKMVAS